MEAGQQAQEPQPLYCVYRAGDLSVVCYRAVRNRPAQVVDFLSFADLESRYAWWDYHRAVGVSCFTDAELAAAIFAPKGFPYIAQLDLAQADPKTPWAPTGRAEHVTIWAPAPQLLQAVVTYVDTGGE